jgi:hypothetical protein
MARADTQSLISPRVLMAVEDVVRVEPVGEFTLKGIRRPLAAYNVLAAASPNAVGHRPDGRIIEAPLETDCAERCKSVGDADAKADIMAKPTPLLGQRSDHVTHFERHQDGLECGLLDWDWVIEHDHHAVACVALKCTAVLDDCLTNCRVVVAQQGHHVFWVSAFRKACEAA